MSAAQTGASSRAWSIRPARIGDVPELHRLELALFPGDAWSEHMLAAEIAHETRCYLVAEQPTRPDGERIVGYAGVMAVAETADVQNIAVVPQLRGQGLGSSLLRALHGIAADRGAHEILLEVRESNETAQSLYRRFGYREIAQRPRYYPDGETAVIMRAPLGPADAGPPRPPSTTDLTSHMDTRAAAHDDSREDPR